MRLAVTVGAAALLAACSTGGGQESEPTTRTPLSVPAPTTTSAAPALPKSPPLPTTAPKPGTPIAQAIAWVEAGAQADPAGFHSATRDGAVTDLGQDVAFVAPSGKQRCATDASVNGQLACLIRADGLPDKPADVEGEWIAGWVDFAGETVDIGSLHGDPGRFGDGDGAALPAGKSLAFGDYRCRADANTLVCVDYAHQSGVLLNTSGVQPLGCLKPVPPPVGVGRRLACPPA